MAIIFTALTLVPSGAHFFELPNKIGLSKQDYFAVQQIYRGWSHFGVLIVTTMVLNLAVAIILKSRRLARWLAFMGFVLIGATLVIFFLWTYPANQATNNWTETPANWQQLRRQWEYSHAANAGVAFSALCVMVASAMSS